MSDDASAAARDEAAEIRGLLDVIFRRYGYDLRGYAAVSLRRRVMAVLARSGLRDLRALRDRVLRDPPFFATVLEGLTVRVSEMFRDPRFYQTFRVRVVPLLRTYPFLNVWHSGCSSGEEVYSMAILLAEEGLYERTQIYATDLSLEALVQAREGVYAGEHLAAFTRNYVDAGGTASFSAYHTAAYDGFAIREALRRKILFFQHDLVSDQVFSEMHVILCRNVLIYFGPELRQRVYDKFSGSARSGGFLCLGSAESLPRPAGAPFVDYAPEDRIYRRR